MAGIYIIEAVDGNVKKIGWKYVGQTVCPRSRKNGHFSALRNNKLTPLKTREYKLLSPHKEVFTTNNLRQFSQQHGLCRVGLGRVINGKTPHYKNWTQYKEQPCPL